MPYRSSEIVEGPPPNSLVALLWRWILLRRADKFEAEERKTVLALEAPRPTKKRVAIHMRRASSIDPYIPYRVEINTCPGKLADRPDDLTGTGVRDYWLCTKEHCCCEVER